MKSKTEKRADAYYTAKEQMVSALTKLANHLHCPPRSMWKMPEQITIHDINRIRRAHMDICEIAAKFDLEINVLEL